MSIVESLLCAVDKIFEKQGEYTRKGELVSTPMKLSIESRDVVSGSENALNVSFRFTVFSCDASAFKNSSGTFIAPSRGDQLVFGGTSYRIVEFDGVTWKYRFDMFSSRILIFAEQAG